MHNAVRAIQYVSAASTYRCMRADYKFGVKKKKSNVASGNIYLYCTVTTIHDFTRFKLPPSPGVMSYPVPCTSSLQFTERISQGMTSSESQRQRYVLLLCMLVCE